MRHGLGERVSDLFRNLSERRQTLGECLIVFSGEKPSPRLIGLSDIERAFITALR